MCAKQDGMISCMSIYGRQVEVPLNKFIFRPSVYAVLEKNRKILLVRHRRSGEYVFPGGGIEIGEPMLEALKRELLEEAGIEIEILSFFHFMEHFFYVDSQDQGYHSLMFFYKARSISNAARSYEARPNNDPEEVIWVDMVDLRREDFYSPFREAYDLLH